MKAVKFIIIIAIFFLAQTVQAGSPLANYMGTWENANTNTSGMTQLVIGKSGSKVTMQGFGSCTPSDCDWGRTVGQPHSSSTSQSYTTKTEVIQGNFNKTKGISTTVIASLSGSTMTVQTMTSFTDGRKSYYKRYKFKKATTASNDDCGKEDCVNFNPKNLKVLKKSSSLYIVMDGSHSVFSAPNQTEANRIVKICQFYGYNQSCYVGRPNPSFTYQLRSGKAVSGKLTGEDCNSFNPATTKVVNIKGRWKVVDGSHWIFDFGSNEKEARQTLCIIKKYGYTKSCYVGRPNPSFSYMRK